MESINIIVLEANATEGFIQSYPLGDLSLKDMQDLVKGFIELINLNESQYMVVNEDGKMLKLPYNKLANDVLKHNNPLLADSNRIVGNAFIMDKKDIE